MTFGKRIGISINLVVLIVCLPANAHAIKDYYYVLGQFPGQMVILGEDNEDLAGYAVIAADFNNDEIDDIVLSAPGNDTEYGIDSGTIYIIYGASRYKLVDILDLKRVGQSDIVVYGEKDNHNIGHQIISGDLNNDQNTDLIFSFGIFGELNEPIFRTKNCFVDILPGPLDFEETTFFYLNDEGTEDVLLIGSGLGDNFGWDFSVSDFNGDGMNALGIGAPDYRGERGLVHIFLWKSDLELPHTQDLGETPAEIIFGGTEKDFYFGYSLAMGDFNGDKQTDIVISAPYVSEEYKVDFGCLYIFYGPLENGYMDDKSASIGTIIKGDSAFDILGMKLLAEDLDGDEKDEIIVGAPGYDFLESGRADAGAVFVLSYDEDWNRASFTLSEAGYILRVIGERSSARIGEYLALGDLNGDGEYDLAIGNPFANTDRGLDTGKVYLIESLISHTGDIDLEESESLITFWGDEEGEEAGGSLDFGDINGDGIQDLLIGAPQGRTSSSNVPGKVYIFWGKEDLREDAYVFDRTKPRNDDEGGSSGGCFISSAVFGADSPETKKLIEIRDDLLLRYEEGKALVNLYYQTSPPLAEFIDRHPTARIIFRALLAPLSMILK